MNAVQNNALRSRWVTVASCAALLGGAAACSGDDERVGSGGFGANSGSGAGGIAGLSGGGGNAGAGGIAGAGGVAGLGGNGGGNGSAVCKHVDLVIAVDGSSSMNEELQAMRDVVFPAFAQRLQTLGAHLDDFRVATLDACPMPANFHTRGAGGECNFSGGEAWIESSSPAIADEFACVGDIYLADQQCSGNNDDEQPASSVIAALQPNGPNAGFQRTDALLIVIAITDEDEQPTAQANRPDDIYRGLVQSAAGDPRRMVFLGIGGASDCAGAYGSANRADDLRELTALFEAHDRGVFWDLCEGRLEDGLDEAFRVIENACNNLCGGIDYDCGGGVPPGVGFCQMFPNDPVCMPE